MLRKEIINCMTELSLNSEGFESRFVFPDTFTGFNGHFPGNPILPGVCILQAVLVAAEAWQKAAVKLNEIVVAKFFLPVSPDDELWCVCEVVNGKTGGSLLRAVVTCGDKKVAKVTLRVADLGAIGDNG